MEKKSVLFLLTPKTKVACLNVNMNVRQALEKMRAHGFSAIPLISNEGEYIGTVSEGDLLWHIAEEKEISLEHLKEDNITDLERRHDVPAVKVDADIDVLVEKIVNHNFVPVVDDRNVLMGIVTRRRVMQELLEKY
ncbi:MAG: CBS domain-containing protein [Erysipelotrichaceae bacterium]|nr:CBS domain-containing protein [Erysipelotrichaceae bacterium]